MAAEKKNNVTPTRSTRRQLLDSGVEFLPVPPGTSVILRGMGFTTVREAFRAGLAGRLASRKKGGKKFENLVLEAGCKLLGHPRLTREEIKGFRPPSVTQTVGESLVAFAGRPFTLTEPFLSRSIREILLPSSMHGALLELKINTIAQLVSTPLARLIDNSAIGTVHLGTFLAYIFDYIFVVNEQPLPSQSIELDLPKLPPAAPPPGTERMLAPWFSEAALAEGSEMVAAGTIKNAFIFRNGAAGVFQDRDSFQVLVLFEEAPSIPQGFKVSHAVCDLCPGTRSRLELCPHVAALTMTMVADDEQAPWHRRPLPLFFRESPWYLAGQILYDLYGSGTNKYITAARENGNWRLTMTHESGCPWVSWLISEKILLETVAIYGELFEFHDPLPEALDDLAPLFRRLTALARTPTEIELNDLGKRTIGQERDESIWIWLGTRLCMTLPTAQLTVHRPEGEELFKFSVRGPENDGDIISLTLPRAKTPDLIDGLARLGVTDNLLPVAQAFCRAAFDEYDCLVITAHIRLTDDRVLDRAELENSRYGRYYYLADEGFLAVKEQRPEHTFGDNHTIAIRIKPNNLPEFIKENQTAIHAPENDIAESLITFKVQLTPDNLELDSFAIEGDWCYLSGHYGVGNRNISLLELLAARRQKLNFLPGRGDWLQLTESSLDWLHNLGDDRIWSDSDSTPQGVRLSKREMLMLSALIPELRVSEAGRGRALLAELLDTEAWQDCRDLDCIPEHLRGYQRNGIAWLYHLYQNGLAGILADDMGLGKTHQALGLLGAIKHHGGSGKRSLIVCPATVVPHWADKITRFFPEFGFYIYHGTRRNLELAEEHQLFITTYGIVRRDAEELAKIDFDVIIFDEIQQVKNKKTGVYNAARLLRGKIVLGLTGTPLENSVYDLKAIFDICLPGFLGTDKTFRTRYADPIGEMGDKGKKDTLARLINPFLLRRTREQVLKELPDIIEDTRTCRLSEDQVRLYRDILNMQGRPLLEELENAEGQNSAPKGSYMKLLAVINYLKQICNHPCLMHDSKDPDLFASGKWDLFVELIDECMEANIKVVVFSHYTRMLDLIETHLQKKSIPFCGLRGEMSIRKRQEMIHTFNTDENCRVFSASLLAGGVGVDLTAAQAVIHYDRWWNAAREDQATARVHRMGQKHVVQVFKLITVGTLEEKINHMIDKKRDLARHLVREDDDSILKRLSREELIDLLTVDDFSV